MKHQLLATIVAIFFSFCGNSQIELEVIEDNPDFANTRFQVGISLDSDFDFRTHIMHYLSTEFIWDEKHLEFSLTQMGASFKDERSDFHGSNKSENEFQQYNTFEIGATYNFIDKIKIVPIEIKLASSSRGNTTTNTVTYVDGKKHIRFGVRAGLYRHAQSLMGYDAYDKYITLENGLTIPDSYTGNSSFAAETEREDPSVNNVFTAERHLNLYVGLAVHSTVGIKVDTDIYGEKSKHANWTLYADLLLGMASDIQKLAFEGTLYDLTEAKHGVEYKNIGARIGYRSVMGKKHGLVLNMEAGMRPRYMDNKFYTQLTLGYSFSELF